MEYKFKRGFSPDLSRIRDVLESEFQCALGLEETGKLHFSYGALKSISVWIEDEKLQVITESATDASEDVVLDTNRRFRKFLERACGYTAKERMKMAKKEVQSS